MQDAQQDAQNTARFRLGQIVRHKDCAFEGLVVDVDASYAGPHEETGSVCAKQPFYHVLVMVEEGRVIAYAAEDALVPTPDVEPLTKAAEKALFTVDQEGRHAPRDRSLQ